MRHHAKFVAVLQKWKIANENPRQWMATILEIQNRQ